MRHILTPLLLLGVLVAPLTILAQANPPRTSPRPFVLPGSSGTASPKPAELVSCFDHYAFGSVPASVSPSVTATVPGATVNFSGTLSNNNAYPIIDAVVYVKIFRTRNTEKDVNGPDVVAFFPATERIDLKAEETQALSFTWDVPNDAEPGEYKVATYVVTSDRFELSGLVFTDDVVGSQTNFTVSGESSGAVRFDKGSITVADMPFRFAAFPPTVPATLNEVEVKAKIENTTKQPFKGTIVWKVYYWDSIEGEHLLDTQTQEVEAHPESSRDVSLSISDKEHSVYFIEGVLENPAGSTSVVGIRFVRAGINEPRFNFVAVDQGTAVACIHSTGSGTAENGKVTLSVTGNSWWQKLLGFVGIGELASASYEGLIPGEIYALAVPLKGSSPSYAITASLSQKGEHIDTVTVSYSCDVLGTKCGMSVLISILLALLALGAIATGIVLWRRRSAKATPPFSVPNQPA